MFDVWSPQQDFPAI